MGAVIQQVSTAHAYATTVHAYATTVDPTQEVVCVNHYGNGDETDVWRVRHGLRLLVKFILAAAR